MIEKKEIVKPDYSNVVGQDSLTRFEKNFKKNPNSNQNRNKQYRSNQNSNRQNNSSKGNNA